MRLLSVMLLALGLLGGLFAAETSYLQQAEAAWQRDAVDEAKRLVRLALADELSPAERTRAETLLASIKARENESAVAGAGEQATTVQATEREQMRQRLQRLLDKPVLVAADWQAYADFRRRYPNDPLLVEIDARFRPAWAEQAGHDDFGRWASCRIGRTLVRFRLIPQGAVTLADGQILSLQQDLWVSEYEATSGLRGAMGCGEASASEALPCAGLSVESIRAGVALLRRDLAGAVLRLPTPAEWAYAARAGSTGAYLPGFDRLDDGVFDRLAPAEVGGHAANAWGLYDIHGNVWELVVDDRGVAWRCGGGWRSRRTACALDGLYPALQHVPDDTLGFRLVIEAEGPP